MLHVSCCTFVLLLKYLVFQSGTPIGIILAHPGVLPCPCPSLASNYANLYLVPISFWMLTIPWTFLESASPKRHPSEPHPPLQHATSEDGSCAAIFGMLCCRSCTATLAFLQCGRHFDQIGKSCSKRKTAVQH